MSENKIGKIHKICAIVTAILIIAVAVGLIICCISIYQSGDRPFSREAITQALYNLRIFGWSCLLLVLLGGLLCIFAPKPEANASAVRDEKDQLLRYPDGKNSERRFRKVGRIVTSLLIAGQYIYPVVYFSDPSHFGVTDITADVASAVGVLIAPLLLTAGFLLVWEHFSRKSIHRELESYKAEGIKPQNVNHVEKPTPKQVLILRYVLVSVAVILIVMGILNDGVADVVGKAIRICTECIGLG